MMENITIVRRTAQATSRWAGGTTTQLAIWPYAAEYKARNFIWRLSSAVVEDEESEFTLLPGIERIIMTLDGDLWLDHKGHHQILLHRFEQDRFRGEWITRSKGCVTDFNLMMAEGCHGKITAIEIKPRQVVELAPVRGKMAALYCVGASLRLMQAGIQEELEDGDLALLSQSAAGWSAVSATNQTIYAVRADMDFDN